MIFITLKEFEKTSISHQFRDNVNGFFHSANCVKLYEFAMSKFLHNLCLSEEIFWIHCARFECFYGNGCRVVPETFPYFTKLSLAKFANEFEG